MGCRTEKSMTESIISEGWREFSVTTISSQNYTRAFKWLFVIVLLALIVVVSFILKSWNSKNWHILWIAPLSIVIVPSIWFVQDFQISQLQVNLLKDIENIWKLEWSLITNICELKFLTWLMTVPNNIFQYKKKYYNFSNQF